MAGQAGKAGSKRPVVNQRRERVSFAEAMRTANRRAHEQANRRSGRRAQRSVRAAISSVDYEDEYPRMAWTKQVQRVLLALLLLPVCWVTTWTFLSMFDESLVRGFWQTKEFMWFAVGVVLMLGCFAFRIGFNGLLYLYVLGHEVTHALFVYCFLGRVTGFKASVDGGYITTTKTNLVIALSPYFVPLLAVLVSVVYVLARHFLVLSDGWDLFYYALLGAAWTFHMVWTLWMVPRDQPDLKEHGTFFSLVLIYLVNVLLLVGLFCLADEAPLYYGKRFLLEWIQWAAVGVDTLVRWGGDVYVLMRGAGWL